MTRSKPAIASLGLLVALFGVMAFGTGVAQAFDISDTLKPPVAIDKIEEESASLLTEINKTKVKFLCKEAKLNGVSLLSKGRLSEGTVTFHGCVTYLNGFLSPPCQPYDFENGSKGLFLSQKFKGSLSLHEGELLTVLEPVSGTEFGTIFMGEECAIGEEVPIAGKLTLLDSEVSTAKEVHSVKAGPLTSLTALGNSATVDGTALVKLSSAHTGMKFSGTSNEEGSYWKVDL